MRSLKEKQVEALNEYLRYIFGCQETFKDKEGHLRARADVSKEILNLLEEVDSSDFFEQMEMNEHYKGEDNDRAS